MLVSKTCNAQNATVAVAAAVVVVVGRDKDWSTIRFGRRAHPVARGGGVEQHTGHENFETASVARAAG